MSNPTRFDIDISLTGTTQGWLPWLPDDVEQPSSPGGSRIDNDEYDLDPQFGNGYFEPPSGQANEIWASGLFGVTCGNTCQVGATCTCTCGNTCQVGATCTCTCGNTCQVLATCANTCQVFGTCTCQNCEPIGEYGQA
jgi:hypothetical protein